MKTNMRTMVLAGGALAILMVAGLGYAAAQEITNETNATTDDNATPEGNDPGAHEGKKRGHGDRKDCPKHAAEEGAAVVDENLSAA